MNKLTLVVALLALGLSTFTLYELSRIQTEQNKEEEKVLLTSKEEQHEGEHEEEFEIADVMTKVQRHFNKLYFAGNSENWELAEFYVEEMEEAFESLAAADVMEDGVNVSALVMSKGYQPLEGVEDAVKKQDKDLFTNAYKLQIEQCNSCHALTLHPFIKIKEPETPVYDNQVYTLE